MSKVTHTDQVDSIVPHNKRPRTSDDFYTFCQIVLEHENYEMTRQEELRHSAISPIDSSGSMTSESTHSSIPEDKNLSLDDDTGNESETIDVESYNTVTCYCGKPFAARPMIECSICLTWLHLSCAKVKKNNIPDIFSCQKCKSKQSGISSIHSASSMHFKPTSRRKKRVSL
ncbi:PHD finger protein 23-like [Ctenocephalides felis]|uniref:PHD finger protein 23-like n=1 Tax=Ctenocephalides felis TaxID=7515 RepID=UPI000E6E155E|nr:PHD finger protein 23-like [Ctenocephalides felis]XP_026474114.1 PHD finger protein 23-like [Ctenocephalides felis]